MNDRKPSRRISQALVLLCAAIVSLGCTSKRQQRQSIDALHKELRWQEDQIYQLQDAIEQYQEALANCRAGAKTTSDSTPSTPTQAPERSDNDLPMGVPGLPRVELGEPDDDGGLPPIEGVPSLDDAPSSDSSSSDRSTPAESSSFDVREVRLHTVLTGGIDRDGLPGDEGIQVVIEPLDADGKVVAATGEIAIALMDHTLPAGKQRLAFWTFDADKAASESRSGGLSKGLSFDLLWGSNRYPAHRELDVYVRYTTSDGRQLDTRGKVRVRLPEDVADWKKTERFPTADHKTPATIRPVSSFDATTTNR
ncbi:MAG: hypothetical protein MI757_16655 [Pirellulales bacterium]|nr:hypothetical protein [Pirellulales bacterium]